MLTVLLDMYAKYIDTKQNTVIKNNSCFINAVNCCIVDCSYNFNEPRFLFFTFLFFYCTISIFVVSGFEKKKELKIVHVTDPVFRIDRFMNTVLCYPPLEKIRFIIDAD